MLASSFVERETDLSFSSGPHTGRERTAGSVLFVLAISASSAFRPRMECKGMIGLVGGELAELFGTDVWGVEAAVGTKYFTAFDVFQFVAVVW